MRYRKMMFAILLFYVVLLLSGSQDVRAAEKQTVKVGCIDIEGFLLVDEEGVASGYAAEYLAEIGKYAHWEYEYIDGSWMECLTWLKEGKIDLLMPAEYTEDRTADYLFSEESCCMDYAALIGLKADEDLYYEDYAKFDQMTVGVIKGNYLNEVFDRYAEENHFSVVKKYYPNGQKLVKALEKGQVDSIVNGNMNYRETQKLLAKIDYMPAYFITSVNRPDLMEQLNKAQHRIHLDNPYYAAELHEKYYGYIQRQAEGFTREEAEFIKQSDELQILCRTDNYPLSWYDSDRGELEGIYPDMLRAIGASGGLKYRLVGYDKDKNPLDMLQNGEGDILVAAAPGKEIENNPEIWLSDVYYKMPYTVLGEQSKTLLENKKQRVAMMKQEYGLGDWIEENNPSWEITFYDTWDGCMKAIKDQVQDLMPVNAPAWQTRSVFRGESELVNLTTASFFAPVSMGVSARQSEILVDVLNKMIRKVDAADMEKCVLDNTMLAERQVTLMELIRQNPVPTAVFCSSGAVLIVLFFGMLYIYRMKARQNKELEEKNKQLEEAHKLEQELTHKMQMDKLTGLYDKISTENIVENHLLTDGSGVMLILDLDNFKYVNDHYGHKQGDKLIRAISVALKSFCRAEDIAGRIGGDEFLLFLKTSRGNGMEERLEALRRAIKNITVIPGVTISCSIGAAFAPRDGSDFSSLYEAADRAMYEAKRSGRDCYMTSPERED